MKRYDYGVRRASDVVRMSPEYVDYWLDRARKGRVRWTTRLFLRRKRAFLDGFIDGLEAHLEQARLGGAVLRSAGSRRLESDRADASSRLVGLSDLGR